jgi:Luciferase-like monooxygenase
MAEMKYGISVSPAGPAGNPRTMAGLGALAEQSGWDGFFVEDYLVFAGKLGTSTYDPWVVLSSVAMTTKRIRLGTMATPLPRRRPWKVAAEVVTLDHLSEGRVILGVGLGGSGEVDFLATGEPSDNRVLAERLDEGLDIIAQLWTGEPVTYHGRQYQLEGMQLRPTPVQQPRVPIWIGGDLMRAGVRKRLARWDGSCAYSSARSRPSEMNADDVRDTISLVEQQQGSGAASPSRTKMATTNRLSTNVFSWPGCPLIAWRRSTRCPPASSQPAPNRPCRVPGATSLRPYPPTVGRPTTAATAAPPRTAWWPIAQQGPKVPRLWHEHRDPTSCDERRASNGADLCRLVERRVR